RTMRARAGSAAGGAAGAGRPAAAAAVRGWTHTRSSPAVTLPGRGSEGRKRVRGEKKGGDKRHSPTAAKHYLRSARAARSGARGGRGGRSSSRRW
ncbi:unnamed protein product, partial [Closterium sp. Naga37s-1]